MKIIPASLISGLLAWCTLPAAADFERRTDITPALIYWQACAEMPDLSAEEHQLSNTFDTAPLDEASGALVAKYDFALRLVWQAARMKARCEWEVDIDDGPDALLPHLAKCKSLAQAARLRARYFLNTGQPNEALQDLLGVFILSRHVASDGILISALVQIAIENIVIYAVAENFSSFPPETLQQLVDGIAASPARGTIRQCIVMEKRGFTDWYKRKIHDLQTQNHASRSRKSRAR